MALETACQPDSSAQNAASRAGSALSSGSAAIGPDVGVLRTLLHDAERVALGVGQHHPGDVALADVEVLRAEVEGALHDLGLPGAPADVEVQPRLGEPRLGHGLEAEIEHQPVGHGEPGLVQVGLLGQCGPPSSASQKRPRVRASWASMARFSRYMTPTPTTHHDLLRVLPAGRQRMAVSSRSDTLGHSAALKPAVRWCSSRYLICPVGETT